MQVDVGLEGLEEIEIDPALMYDVNSSRSPLTMHLAMQRKFTS